MVHLSRGEKKKKVSKSSRTDFLIIYIMDHPHHKSLPTVYRGDCTDQKSLLSPEQLLEVHYGSHFSADGGASLGWYMVPG